MPDLLTVEAYEDPQWDGTWATCPHCKWDKGVTWIGEKKCASCEGTFKVAPGPLVQEPATS